MSVNFAGGMLEGRWPCGVVTAPGQPCVLPAGRVVDNAPPQFLDSPRNPAWPKFPSVPSGWYLKYEYPPELDLGTETGGQLVTSVGALAVYARGAFAYYADWEAVERPTGPDPPPPNGWAVSVADYDLGTAMPGELTSISVTAGAGATQGRVGSGSGPVSVRVSCLRDPHTVSNVYIDVAVAWTAVYTALDMSLLRPGAWAALTTDINYPNDDRAALLTVTGGAPLLPIYADGNTKAPSSSGGYERFVLLVNAGSPIPDPSGWGEVNWFEDTDIANGRRAQQGLPPVADPRYAVSWCVAQRVGAPGNDPSAGVPTYRVPLPPYYFPPGSDLLAPALYYLYSASHFEPVTRSWQGLTLTGESVGLLPPGSAVVRLHFGSGLGGSPPPPKPPGASPALLGRPSAHYHRAVAALSADGLSTTGILYWRSDRPVPAMQVGGPDAGRVWDTPRGALGVKVTQTAGDVSPRLALDHRRLLFLIFCRPAQGALLCRSGDDGDTWSSPTMAIRFGTHPNIACADGRTLLAAVTPAPDSTTSSPKFYLSAAYQAAGDPAPSAPFVCMKAGSAGGTGTPLRVADDSFGLAFAAEGPDRLTLHVLIAGELATSDWWSADGARTWTRVQGS